MSEVKTNSVAIGACLLLTGCVGGIPQVAFESNEETVGALVLSIDETDPMDAFDRAIFDIVTADIVEQNHAIKAKSATVSSLNPSVAQSSKINLYCGNLGCLSDTRRQEEQASNTPKEYQLELQVQFSPTPRPSCNGWMQINSVVALKSNQIDTREFLALNQCSKS